MRERDIFDKIIEIGKRRGVLTYNEINEALPAEFLSPEELEELMDLLSDMGIEVVDEQETDTPEEEISVSEEELEEDEKILEKKREATRLTKEKPQITPYKKGDFIGQWHEVYEVLGMGGFGIVYLVLFHELKRVFALKTFRDEYFEDIATRERFKKEAQIWIDLERHPYLVRAHSIKEISDRLFIAMEYIAPDEQGLNSLEGYLRRNPPDLAQSLKWAIQFCYGMEYAYSKGIRAHRDIKPANIMIGHDKAVKISDFGLSGVVSTTKSSSDVKLSATRNVSGEAYQTMEGTAFGTPPYMSPEQFENAAGCDERSDIYSFGIVLYQMVSGGKLPFYPDISGDSADDIFQNWYMLHCKATIPKLKTPLFPVIQKCLEKEKRKRYQSFRELRADLAPLLKRETSEIVKLPELKELEAWEWFNKGMSLGILDKKEEAIACYDKGLEINPRDAMAWVGKGVVLRSLGKYQEAIACYDKALEINPRYAMAWAGKGVVIGRIGKPQEAIACYDKALEINPRYAEAWYNKGVVLGRSLGKPQVAIACYDKALEINPRLAEAWNSKGVALGKLGKDQEAIACYDKALEINPRDGGAWYNKGNALGRIGKPQEAIACYERAIEINPRDEEAWDSKGAALGRLRKYQEVIACYDRALEINPKYATAWHKKGLALGILVKFQEAIVCYDKALEINPRDARTWHSKGNALVCLVKLQEAKACYDKAVEINPGYAMAWYSKAQIEDVLGMKQDAVYSFREFISLASNEYVEKIEYARKRLRELESE